MKYAIFVDVDGTLLDNKQQIPESAVYAIQNARKKGHYVFLNTGRCKAELFESILDVGFDGIIYSSGGYIEYEGQYIRHLTFDENDIQSLIQYFEKKQDWLLLRMQSRHVCRYTVSGLDARSF